MGKNCGWFLVVSVWCFIALLIMTLASFLSRTSFSRPELSWGISWPPSVCGSGCSCRWRRRLNDVSQASAPHPAHHCSKIIINSFIKSASQQMPHYHVMFSTFIQFFFSLYPTLFASKDSRYSLADSCPSSLLYPLVNSPSACLDGLKGIQIKNAFYWIVRWSSVLSRKLRAVCPHERSSHLQL